MHEDYADIRERIPMDPVWFDEHAVPRYCEFSPRRLADIYADEAVLAAITCQGCSKAFRVAFSRSIKDRVLRPNSRPLAEQIAEKTLHYGDPPNIGCCAAGATMNSEPRRVLEYWLKEAFGDWQRNAALEVSIEPEWVEDRDG